MGESACTSTASTGCVFTGVRFVQAQLLLCLTGARRAVTPRFTADEVKLAGFSAALMREGKYSANEMIAAQFRPRSDAV